MALPTATVRPRHLSLDPVQDVEERVRVEPLVVDGAKVLRPDEPLAELVALGLLQGVGQAELRRGHEQVERVVRPDRGLDDAMAHDYRHVAEIWELTRLDRSILPPAGAAAILGALKVMAEEAGSER